MELSKIAPFFQKKIWIVWSVLFFLLLIVLYNLCSNKIESDKSSILKNEQYKNEIETKLQSLLISTIEASYYISYLNLQENLIFNDDIYYQKDLAKIDYSFVPVKRPKFVYDNGKCVLTVQLARAKHNPKDKRTVLLKTSSKTHIIKEDIAKIMNDTLMNYDEQFRDINYSLAEKNLTNMLDRVAIKHNCSLDLTITE